MSRRRLQVAFDTAGSRASGIGHVLRSLSLAERVRRTGARVTLVGSIASTPMASMSLPRTVAPPDVLVVDRPDTTGDLLRRRHERWPLARIVVLDYYGPAMDGIVAVVNLNEGRERTHRVRPAGYRLGLEYATLRRSFQERRRQRRTVPSRVRRIVVAFGGTDPSGWTAAAVEALRAVSATASIDVLSGRPLAARLSSGDARVTVHVSLRDPAALLQRSDLAVIGGGTMMIEAACLGLPAIIIPRTPEERVFARQFTRAGAVRLLQPRAAFPAGALRREAARLLDDRQARVRMVRAGRRLVDGRGAERVARLIVRAGGMAA